MKKPIFKYLIFFFAIIFIISGCSKNEQAPDSLEAAETIPSSYTLDFNWNDEDIGEDFDIEIISSDNGEGFSIEKTAGSAKVAIENTAGDYDITFVYLPPIGVLNNIPQCDVSIYQDDKLINTLSSSENTLYRAPTGAVGFGICSIKNGKLSEYSGEWKNLSANP